MVNRRWGVAGGAAVVMLMLGGVAATAIAGSQAKSRLQAAPRAWQAQWPMLKVVDEHYERGLWSSTHEFTLQWGCDAGASPLALTLRQRVQHGPLPGGQTVAAAVVDTELVLPEAARQRWAEVAGARAPLRAHTVVGFTGASTTTLSVPPLQTMAADGSQIAFQGLEIELRDSGSALHYDMSMPRLSIARRDERVAMAMTLTGARASGQLTGEGSLWLRPGRGSAELGSLELGVAGAGPQLKLALQDLKLTSEATLDHELLQAVTRASARGRVNEHVLDKIELQASVKRLNAARYERLLQRVMDQSAAGCDVRQAVSPQTLLAQVQQDLMALLPPNPEFALDRLAVESGGQRAELSYAVGVQGVTAEDAAQPLAAVALAKGRLRAQMRVPAAWVQAGLATLSGAPGADATASEDMAEVMLAKLGNDGMLLREGDMLRAQLSYEQGRWLVNGKPPARPAP